MVSFEAFELIIGLTFWSTGGTQLVISLFFSEAESCALPCNRMKLQLISAFIK